MKVLLVDDQYAVIESLKKGIDWDKISVDKIYTAYSAKEAKMILRNFAVDILVTDIEMPGESGLSLFQWVREEKSEMEGIFLTSHAEFEYAHKAIQLGGFDYILQPARNIDIERVLVKVSERVKKKNKLKQLETVNELVQKQKNNILESLLIKVNRGKKEAANQLFENFPSLFQMEKENAILLSLLVQLFLDGQKEENLDESLISLVFSNVIEELFETENGKATVAAFGENQYWILLAVQKDKINNCFYKQKIEDFYDFITNNMEIAISIYPFLPLESEKFTDIYEALCKREQTNKSKKTGLFWENHTNPQKSDITEDSIEIAKRYIANNLNKNFSRKDVADSVYLNEEYFSRLFKQHTGLTFKEYIAVERMKEAKKLLRESKLSISIIASKIGYDNFSYFSKIFKKATGKTPQEYRRDFINNI